MAGVDIGLSLRVCVRVRVRVRVPVRRIPALSLKSPSYEFARHP